MKPSVIAIDPSLPIHFLLSLLVVFVGCSSTKWGTYEGKSLGRALNIGEAGEENVRYDGDGKVITAERKWLKGTQSDTLTGFKYFLDFGALMFEQGKKTGANTVVPGSGNLVP